MLDFVIQKNITSYAFDPRIHSEKMLDYLESNYESHAQKLTSSYSVSDRSNTLPSMEEVSNQLDYYKGKVKSEISKAKVKSGLRTNSNLLLRFPG